MFIVNHRTIKTGEYFISFVRGKRSGIKCIIPNVYSLSLRVAPSSMSLAFVALNPKFTEVGFEIDEGTRAVAKQAGFYVKLIMIHC